MMSPDVSSAATSLLVSCTALNSMKQNVASLASQTLSTGCGVVMPTEAAVRVKKCTSVDSVTPEEEAGRLPTKIRRAALVICTCCRLSVTDTVEDAEVSGLEGTGMGFPSLTALRASATAFASNLR
jgi:S-methylmethionine-dependent homocysteine/selenocysteine methylase